MIVMNWKTGCTGNEETRKRKIVIVGTFVVVLCCVVLCVYGGDDRWFYFFCFCDTLFWNLFLFFVFYFIFGD